MPQKSRSSLVIYTYSQAWKAYWAHDLNIPRLVVDMDWKPGEKKHSAQPLESLSHPNPCSASGVE